MKELETKPHIFEGIDEETGEYIKSEGQKIQNYRFYLRFISKWFTPCAEDQKRIGELIRRGNLIIGNKDYAHPIELSRSWEIDDNAWVEVERREATEQDYKKQFGDFWQEPWNDYQEEQKNK